MSRIIYVNQNASAQGNGSSWNTAVNDLQSALAQAQKGDQIWVAKGTYTPTSTDDRTKSFRLKEGVEVYGGFAGNETSINQRNLKKNVTTLSGNIGDKNKLDDNTEHVLIGAKDAVLDGFKVSDGYALNPTNKPGAPTGANGNMQGPPSMQGPPADALKKQSRQLGDTCIPRRQPNPNVNLNDTNLAGGKADRPKPGNIKQSDRIIYVNNQADVKNPNGSSWDAAYTDLNVALKDAAKDGAQVWVAEGNYVPQGQGRDASFKLGDGVRVYGGFKGSETSLSQADPSKNATILNGDLGKKGNATDNAYHVVTGGQKASLKGFVVANGYADGEGYNSHGGGMVNYDKDKPQGRPDLELGYHVDVQNSIFMNNYAKTCGAVYNYGNSDVTFKNNAFVRNTADNGGAIKDVAGVHGTYTNNIFLKNSAKYNSGAGMEDYGSQSTFTNNAFIVNTAIDGGALYGDSRASQIGQTNMIVDGNGFVLNMATRNGGAVNANDASIAQLRNNQNLLNLDPRLLAFSSTADGKLQTYDPTKTTSTSNQPPQMGGQQPPQMGGQQPPQMGGQQPPQMGGQQPPQMVGQQPPMGPPPPQMGGQPPMGPPPPFGMPPRSMAI